MDLIKSWNTHTGIDTGIAIIMKMKRNKFLTMLKTMPAFFANCFFTFIFKNPPVYFFINLAFNEIIYRLINERYYLFKIYIIISNLTIS